MRTALGRVVAAANHVRGAVDGAPYKEWFHFAVVADGVEALLNLSVSDDTRPAAKSGARLGRAIAIVRERDAGWTGAIETHDFAASQHEIAAPQNKSQTLRIGENSLRPVGDGYQLTLRTARVACDLWLRPRAVPLVGVGVDLGDGTLNWVVVPRLTADGTLTAFGREHRLRGARAYHDHNWGAWQWGADFAWQWGFALGERHSVVFSRLTDRARARAWDTKLCVWDGETLARVFAGPEVKISVEGCLPPRPVPRFPEVLGLVTAGEAIDVPRRLVAEAERPGARVRCAFTAEDAAEIVIPNETDLGFTRIDEVSGAVCAEGAIDGAQFRIEGRAVFEFLSFA